MKPRFALTLSPEGIVLQHRSAGGWLRVGQVSPADPDLSSAMKMMRETAAELDSGGVRSKLVLPDEQILYTRITLSGDAPPEDQIRAGLEGLTPYDVADIVFDWARDGDTARIAAVARETLQEAEKFAAQHRFNPVCLTAAPPADLFPREAWFGPTQAAADLLAAGDAPERETALAPATPGTPVTDVVATPSIPPAAMPQQAAGSFRVGSVVVAVGLAAILIIGAVLLWNIVFDSPQNAPLQSSQDISMPAPVAQDVQPPVPQLQSEPSAADTVQPDQTAAAPAPQPGPYEGDVISLSAQTQPGAPAADDLDRLTIAAIDPVILSQDAGALRAEEGALPDDQMPPPAPLAGPGQKFDLDERGLVIPSPQGTRNPDGVLVFAGPPPLVPRARPTASAPAAVDPQLAQRMAQLAGFRPKARPANLAQRQERAENFGLTRADLATRLPRPRPDLPPQAQPVPVAPAVVDDGAAMASSRIPAARPRNFSAAVDRALKEAAPPPAAAVATAVKPAIPTKASVAKRATQTDKINLRAINLIGVYGGSGDRRALVRLTSGRYVKVQVGDKIDGGKVAAIGDNDLRYIKDGRSVVLVVPSGG